MTWQDLPGLLLVLGAIAVPATLSGAVIAVIWVNISPSSFTQDRELCIRSMRALWLLGPWLFGVMSTYNFTRLLIHYGYERSTSSNLAGAGVYPGFLLNWVLLVLMSASFVWAWRGHHSHETYIWWLLLWSACEMGMLLYMVILWLNSLAW